MSVTPGTALPPATAPVPAPDRSGGRARRISFVITGLGFGGAETQLLRLASGLAKRGWRTQVVSILPPGPLAPAFERAGIPVVSLHVARGALDPLAVVRLRGILRAARPDVVHSHMVHANLLARVVRPFCTVPVLVCTAHNTNEGGRLRTLAIRWTDRLCDFTTGVSRAVVERYRQHALAADDRLRVVHNGIDTEEFAPSLAARSRVRGELGVDDRFLWLAVGRFVVQKDYPTLLRAFSRVRATAPDAVLAIAGDGPLRGECEALADRLGLIEVVRFLGVRSDVPSLMNAADAFVMSSRWEGLPVVLQEASATGLPIVATGVSGIPDAVVDGRSGFLVGPRDPEALADAMLRLATTPEPQRRAMGEHARSHVQEHFSMPRVLDTWERLYSELLEHAGGSGPEARENGAA